MDELVIRNLKTGTEWKIDSLKAYRLAEEGDWLAYQRTRKDSSLVVVSLDGTKKYVLPSASAYGFAKEKAALYFVTKEDKDGKKPGMYVWTAEAPQPVLVKEGKGVFVQPAFDKAGQKLAFLYTDDKKEKDYTMSLWISENGGTARELANRTTTGLPEGWVISPNQRLSFSDDAARLFLGTAPEPLRKDTTILAANRPNVQVWKWDEPVQYTVQHYNVKRDLKKSYAAISLRCLRIIIAEDIFLRRHVIIECDVTDKVIDDDIESSLTLLVLLLDELDLAPLSCFNASEGLSHLLKLAVDAS